MYGRVANTLDRNAIICLSVTAAVLLLAGLCLAVTAPSARAQAPARSAPAKAAQADTTAATVMAPPTAFVDVSVATVWTSPSKQRPSTGIFGANYWGAVRFIDSARWP
jgi:hypothetical protein